MKYFHTFQVDDTFWVYDRYSNNILQVEHIIYEILQTYPYHNFNEYRVVKLLKTKFDRNVIVDGLNNLIESQKKFNVLLPHDLKSCSANIGEDEFVQKYIKGVNHVIINVTEDCNFNCGYCKYGGSYSSTYTHNKKTISYSVLDNTILFIKNNYSGKEQLRIGFYGGEPLLAINKIKYVIEKIKNENIDCRFGFTTNGSLLSSGVFPFLVENGVNILISLDGPQVVHDRYRIRKNKRGTFNKVLNNIRALENYNSDYYKNSVGFVVTLAPPYNLTKIVDFFEEFVEFSQPIIINYVDPFETSFFEKFDLDRENKFYSDQKENLLKEYENLYKKNLTNSKRLKILNDLFGRAMFRFNERFIYPLNSTDITPNGACYPGLDRVFVASNGDLGVCEKCSPNLKIGDIRNGFNLDAIKSVYNEYCGIVTDVCLNCWAYRLCSSCFIGAVKNDGLFSYEKKKEDCSYKIKSIIKDLEIFTRIKMLNADAFNLESKEYNKQTFY
ncbi:MAG: radical SAM protein [Ignavibacteriaceae bacterium]